MDLIRLFRSLTLRQILGLQLAWASSIGFVFGFTTWLSGRGFRPSATDDVSFTMSLRWDLTTAQILAIVGVLAAPLLLWLLVRDRAARK